MSNDHHNDVFTIGIGGAAGDGVREAGNSLGTILADLGYEVFLSFSYPSLIRGGHNYSRVSFSREKVRCDHEKLDVLVALNEETIKLHHDELHSEQGHFPGVVLADSFDDEDKKRLGENAVAVPMIKSAEGLKAPAITRNSVALGAVAYLLDLDYEAMRKVLGIVFKDKMMETNMKLADIGYEQMKKLGFKHQKRLSSKGSTSQGGRTLSRELVEGNEAFARGLTAAGLDFYVAYPMTPSSSILHYLAKRQLDTKVKVIQPESELSVINMALGVSYAGKRVAIGSATGGFQLMQEAFGFAGIAELPLVVAISQRQAPGTGVPTYSSQADLRLAIHAGDGEFPRIVIAPGDAEEAFMAGANALNLAWKYQVPVIVLLDKILSEHSMTGVFDSKTIQIERGRIAEHTDEKYGRYEISPDGISPMAFPGMSNTVVKANSYEHDRYGITIEEVEPVKEMLEKRFAKARTISDALHMQETVKVYGDRDSKDAVVFWGSTKGAVLEAAKYLDKPVKFVQILWAEPFDSERVKRELSGAKRIINIEGNHNAQMAFLIREKTGIEVTDNILRYDSRPFDPIGLAKELTRLVLED
ncbi:2-oxoacid:acceptor oxidoreductase subunit alpha [Patescibacteria group bacterium]|nr:2-oxoacid:acceptor oxidoreductase subunit alpha [Patescibacteria group bacterium]MDE1946375.1 2-oxoacid:acceptor oxidoreductase subunit alpha [Patescibacteria group bacterium]MDE2010827.1 2-oxoacid:acceptor oxidoreductase subunit alpha [Patescibacteria group bacterium]MDE2233113.1 2-oxoacid:acceptor oxidoreductase subunit alpha [Patescibacteria group bacterium]